MGFDPRWHSMNSGSLPSEQPSASIVIPWKDNGMPENCPYTESDKRSWVGTGPRGEIIFRELTLLCQHEFHPDLSFFGRQYNCCRCFGVVKVHYVEDLDGMTRTEIGELVALEHGGTYVEAVEPEEMPTEDQQRRTQRLTEALGKHGVTILPPPHRCLPRPDRFEALRVEIAAMTLDPEDTLVITMKDSYTPNQLRELSDFARSRVPDGVNVLVLPNAEVTKVRRSIITATAEYEEDAEPEPRHGDHGTCAVCGESISYMTSSYGPWWYHEEHPTDGHDAELGGPA